MEQHNDTVYRQTIVEALKFAWHNKKLWFLAVFAGLLNAGGIIEALVRGVREITSEAVSWPSLADAVVPGSSTLYLLSPMSTANMYSTMQFVVVALIVTAMIALVFYFSALCQGALISAVKAPGAESLSHRIHGETGLGWKLVFANLVTKAVLAGVLLLSLVPALVIPATSAAAVGVTSVVSYLIFVPATLIVTLLGILTLCGIALHRSSAREAFRTALAMFKKHWLILLECAVLLFFASLIFVAILAIQAIFVFVTILLTVSAFGFLVSFQYAAWALIYERLEHGVLPSAIVRYILHPIKRVFSK